MPQIYPRNQSLTPIQTDVSTVSAACQVKTRHTTLKCIKRLDNLRFLSDLIADKGNPVGRDVETRLANQIG
jgi:hypothetical protein